MYTILCIMTCHHFLKKNEWITNVLGLREHKVRSNPLVSVELTECFEDYGSTKCQVSDSINESRKRG